MRVSTQLPRWSTIALVALGGFTDMARAQAPVTSQQRIPVRKESGGEVARRDSVARADSIARAAAARQDSIARAEAARRDSIAAAARADSIARAEAARQDSIARAEAARRDSISRAEAAAAAAAAAAIPAALSRRGFYFGLAAGASMPNGDYGDPYDNGWNVTVPFGWQKAASRWGVRGDIAYDSHGGNSLTSNTVPPIVQDPAPAPPIALGSSMNFDNGSIWSGNLDLTVDLAQWGANKLSSLYLIGGGGVHYFEKPQFNFTPVGGATTTSSEGDSQTKFGLNGGAGLAFGVGRGAHFLESRFFTAYTETKNANWVPIIVGFKWF